MRDYDPCVTCWHCAASLIAIAGLSTSCAPSQSVPRSGDGQSTFVANSNVPVDGGLEPTEELRLSTGGLVSSPACPPVDAAAIAASSVAFKGTVVTRGNGEAKLTVDESYVGAPTSTVTLFAPPGVDAWLGPVSWTVGTQYFVTANSGIVSFCGRSGRATPELRKVFEQAFG
jgi:hypothetical protein